MHADIPFDALYGKNAEGTHLCIPLVPSGIELEEVFTVYPAQLDKFNNEFEIAVDLLGVPRDEDVLKKERKKWLIKIAELITKKLGMSKWKFDIYHALFVLKDNAFTHGRKVGAKILSFRVFKAPARKNFLAYRIIFKSEVTGKEAETPAIWMHLSHTDHQCSRRN